MLNERTRRAWAVIESEEYGYGGISAVARATGISRQTITTGRSFLPNERKSISSQRIRSEGGGRKSIREKYPNIVETLHALLEPAVRGDPVSPLLWSSKSVRKIAEELKKKDIRVSYPVVAELLKQMGFSLQANKKTREGASHPDRNLQFEYIYKQCNEFQKNTQPVISVDTKKKELVGDFKNNGREWKPSGAPEEVRGHDFMDKQLGKVAPYGVYDIGNDAGWVNLGTDGDTAAFAVESIRKWWRRMGCENYPNASKLLITADCGGSNGYRIRLWKKELQQLSNQTGLKITVCHFPPGTSKWNKIEHRLFSHITMNWRGKPLISHEVIVNLIANTRTKSGLTVQCELDHKKYPKKIKVSDEEMQRLNITHHDFHGEWNYTVSPCL